MTYNSLVVEKYGQFPGLLDQTEYFANEIFMQCNGADINPKETYDMIFTKSMLDGIPGVFYKRASFHIHFVEDVNVRASYRVNSSLDKKSMIFKNIDIDLNISYLTEIEPYEIQSSLLHEFTHAYQDYMTQLKGEKYFNKFAEFYRDVEYTDDESDMRNLVKQVLYLTLGHERQAFIAQFAAELELTKKPIKNPADAMEALRETDVYNAYCEMRNFIEQYFEDNIKEDTVKTITDEYNRISHTHLSSNKVFKKLKFLLDEAIAKFDKVIEKLCIQMYS